MTMQNLFLRLTAVRSIAVRPIAVRSIAAQLLTLFLLAGPIAFCQQANNTRTLALVGALIYPSPTAAPIEKGTVLVRNGKIIAVGSADKIAVPPGSRVIDCKGLVLTGAFWNCHVHFIEPKWQNADKIPADQFDRQMADMLTSHGFAHVFDLAEFNIYNTLLMRNRIKEGTVHGPVIYTVGSPLVPQNGSPIYIRPFTLPEASDPEYAIAHVRAQIDSGADGIKLWTGSPVGDSIVHMPEDIVRAITRTAHSLGKPVFAHPTDIIGMMAAVNGGVDVLAHTTPDANRIWSQDTIRQMLAAHIALIPTLKLWTIELHRNHVTEPAYGNFIRTAQQQLHDFAAAGGTVLFGTDVGYIPDYTTADEYTLLAGAGVDFRQVLAMLTTAPAKKFGQAAHTGLIAAGMDADIALLSADPSIDILSFDKVVYTFLRGKIIYASQDR
jgi:imidazolonepropionase-like amidohydrolase